MCVYTHTHTHKVACVRTHTHTHTHKYLTRYLLIITAKKIVPSQRRKVGDTTLSDQNDHQYENKPNMSLFHTKC